MLGQIVAAHRGLVVTVQSLDSENSKARARPIDMIESVINSIICYSYNFSTAKFVKCAECVLNFAAKQIIACSVIEDADSGTIHPCLLIQVDNNATQKSQQNSDINRTFYEYQVLHFIQEKSEVVVAASFSTLTSLSDCKVWLLDGPTVCWEFNGSFNIERVNPDKPAAVGTTEQIPNHLWNSEHTLKWCGASRGDIIALATYSVKDETTSSDLWFEDLTIQRNWKLLQCPKVSTDASRIIEMSEVPIISHVYASIINSVYIDRRNQTLLHLTAESIVPDISILATTNQGQLLEFYRGRVHLVCDLPFGDACEILPVSRREGGDLVLVRSESGVVCAVERKTFKVLQQWENIATILVDDFLFNGSEQVLMVPGDPCNKTHPLQGFILTDLDSCYVNEKDSRVDEAIGDSKLMCGENLLSAIRALEARLQGGMASLREAETKCEERSKLIEQSQHALHKMLNGQENSMAKKDQSRLLCIYDGSAQSHEVCQSRVAMVTTDMKVNDIEVFKGWQRVIDTTWVVGVTVQNKHDKMEDLSLSLIPVNCGSSIHLEREPLTSECKVMFSSHPNLSANKSLTKQTLVFDPTEPKTKRRRLNTTECERVQDDPAWLSPGEQTDVVAIATIPEFAGYSVICCDIVLQWRQWDSGNHVMDSGDMEHHWSERVKSCGRVWLSAGDVVKGDLDIELDSSKPRTAEQHQQDVQALDATQISTSLTVTSFHSNLRCILEALKCTMRFTSSAFHDDLVCTSVGALWGVRVALEMDESCHGLLTVRTKDKKQLMLFCHSLYQLLPDDITIRQLLPPFNQVEGSITASIQSMKQELATQVTGVHDIQSASTVQGKDADSVIKEESMDVNEKDATIERSEVNEAAKKLEDVRKTFGTERLKLNDRGTLTFDAERLRERKIVVNDHQQETDAAVRELARNLMYLSQN